MAVMCLYPNGEVRMILATVEDAARMDTVLYNLFLVTTDIPTVSFP